MKKLIAIVIAIMLAMPQQGLATEHAKCPQGVMCEEVSRIPLSDSLRPMSYKNGIGGISTSRANEQEMPIEHENSNAAKKKKSPWYRSAIFISCLILYTVDITAKAAAHYLFNLDNLYEVTTTVPWISSAIYGSNAYGFAISFDGNFFVGLNHHPGWSYTAPYVVPFLVSYALVIILGVSAIILGVLPKPKGMEKFNFIIFFQKMALQLKPLYQTYLSFRIALGMVLGGVASFITDYSYHIISTQKVAGTNYLTIVFDSSRFDFNMTDIAVVTYIFIAVYNVIMYSLKPSKAGSMTNENKTADELSDPAPVDHKAMPDELADELAVQPSVEASVISGLGASLPNAEFNQTLTKAILSAA